MWAFIIGFLSVVCESCRPEEGRSAFIDRWTSRSNGVARAWCGAREHPRSLLPRPVWKRFPIMDPHGSVSWALACGVLLGLRMYIFHTLYSTHR